MARLASPPDSLVGSSHLVYDKIMNIILRKLQSNDLQYFTQWWRDPELIKLTSGNFDELSDKKVEKYFNAMLENKTDYHWMIQVDDQTVGHISLNKNRGGWYETQIVIGKKDFWSKGIGSDSINQLIIKAKAENISKIYLEVRPNNSRAIRSYEKSGFKKIKTIKYPNNLNLPETIRMEYQL